VNGFGGKEKEPAIRILLVLDRHTRGGYKLTELEQMVVQAGWSVKQAAQLRELAETVSRGGSFRPAVRMTEADSERIARAYYDASQRAHETS
jgi:hypothetical protein